ncbi:MAG TPA: paraquat-inducible protein A [Burkholderiaceae bacterium]|nr:paraquat-inducible protein A [Burkholderiaceae bacterium]
MKAKETSPSLLCPHCDLLVAASRLQADESAHCPRCRVELDRGRRVSKTTVRAIAASAVPLWVVMNAFPLVTLTLGGERCDSTLFGAALAMLNSGMPALAALVVLTAIVAPAAEILLALHILANLSGSTRVDRLGRVVRWLKRIRHWSMADVFLLGCLVSVVKLSHLAHLVVGPALWACGLLLPALAFVTVHVQPQRLFGSTP